MASTKQPPLGVRRNNPGNIEYSANNPWQGAKRPHDKHRFDSFTTPVYGIRALAALLVSYYDRHKLDTVAKIINRWAPPHEKSPGSNKSQTDPYVEHVVRQTEFAHSEKLNLHEHDTLFKLVKAIIRHENGYHPYDDTTIKAGILAAGVKDNKPDTPVIAKSGSAQAGAAAIGAGVLAIGPQIVEMSTPYIPLLTRVVEVAPWIVGAIVIVAGGYVIWRALRRRQLGIE